MLKRILLILGLFFSVLSIQAQNEYQSNYYDLVKKVRDITKRGYQPIETSLNEFRTEIFEIVKTAHRLEEEALMEALESRNPKLLEDIAFGCKLSDLLLKAVDLKLKTKSKQYDTYIEKLKSLELAITLKIKTQ